jgi:membrane dipeptidase
MICELINRKAVIGVALDAWMLVPEWETGVSDPVKKNVSLKQVIDNIDHICQLAGNSLHAGIGSDLDGAFGKEQCPFDLETIADLQKIPGMLKERGFTNEDVENVMSGNLVRFFTENLA